MRIQDVLIVAALVCTVFAGCAAKRRSRVAEQIESSQPQHQLAQDRLGNTSDYWQGCDQCEVGLVQSSSLPVNPESRLRCSQCNSKQDWLVDGKCIACTKNRGGGRIFPKNVTSSSVVHNEAPPVPVFKQSQIDSSKRRSESQQLVLSNKLPLKTKRQQLVETSSDFLKRSQSKLGGNILQAKNSGTSQVKRQADNLISQIEDSRNEVENATKSIDLAGDGNSRHEFESPIGDLLTRSQKQPVAKTNELKPGKRIEEVSREPFSIESKVEREVAARTISAPTQPAPTQPAPTQPAPTQPAVNADTEVGLSLAPAESDSEIESRRRTNLTGDASIYPDPKFETFKLNDLFPGEKKTQLPSENRQRNAPDRNQSSMNSDSQRQPRTEKQIVEDLRKNTVKSRVVFDTTPEIPQQKFKAPEIVLRATPVGSFRNLSQMASKPLRPSGSRKFSQDEASDFDIDRSLPTTIRATPVKTRKIIQREPIEFSPLPTMEQPVAEVDLSVASSIDDEVYDPYQFPENEKTFESDFEFDGEASSVMEKEIPKLEIRQLPNVDSDTEVLPTLTIPNVKDETILLRAVPSSSGIRNAVQSIHNSTSKARFKFVQPKFQRTIIDE